MSLASRLGLPTAKTEILEVPEKILLVERFDRNNGKRLHQIDVCQFFGELSNKKYQFTPLGPIGINAQQYIDFARACNAEETVLKWVVFNFLAGNTDCHAKNISALVSENGYTLTPFYDLLCTSVYKQYEMAFSIGGVDHLSLIDKDCWKEFAASCGLEDSLVFSTLADMAAKMPKTFQEIADSMPLSIEERDFVSKISDLIAEQCKKVESYAEEGLKPQF